MIVFVRFVTNFVVVDPPPIITIDSGTVNLFVGESEIALVLPLKMRKSNPTTLLVCAGLILAIIGVTGCLNGGGGESVTPSLESPEAHEGYISVKATISGDKNSYNISLSAPNGTIVDYEIVPESDMSSGQASVWMLMAGYNENPPTGDYEVIVNDFDGNTGLASGTVHYTTINLEIDQAQFSWSESGDHYQLDNVTASVNNTGQVGFASDMNATVGDESSISYVGSMMSALSIPSGSSSVLASSFVMLIENGTYSATIDLLNNNGEILATYSITETVP